MAVAALSPAGILRSRGDRVIAALDVGSAKVGALIAAVEGDGPPRVLGAGVRACGGVKRGLVADMEKTEAAIRAAMMQAEKAAGLEIESVLVNISAGGLESDIASVEIDIAGHRISDEDMMALLAAGRQRIEAGTRQGGRTVLHAEPTLYTVDGLDGVTNPRGFHANQLGVDIHVVSAATPPCRNLDLAVRNAHLDVEAIVASGLAASLAILNEEERELGVAVIEIGAGVTTVALHVGGVLAALHALPVGAADITSDIAASFGTSRAVAERLKTLHGAASAVPRDNHDMIEIPPLDPEEAADGRRIPRAELIAVIRARLDRILAEVGNVLESLGFTGPAGTQVVLTGGGAELRGIADFAGMALSRNVRIGRPRGLAGLPDAHSGAAFATLAGLVLHGARPRLDLARLGGPLPGAAGPVSAREGTFRRLLSTLRKQF